MLEQVSSEQDVEDNIVFKKLVENIKSFAVKLSNREERRIVAAWVNKLCEPLYSSTSQTERKNRNLYAQILLKMLQKTHLKKPFTEKPNTGKLPTIPVYMSSYLNESESGREPQWLLNNALEDSILLHSFNYDTTVDSKVDMEFKASSIFPPEHLYVPYPTKKESKDFFQIPEANELEYYLKSQQKNDEDQKRRKSTLIASEQLNKDIDSMLLEDDSVLQDVEEISSKYSSPNNCFQDISKEKALEKKLEFLERKIEIESSRIQQQQDAIIKNILNRKNKEMSEIKLFYQKKMVELEAVINTRDHTVSTLNMKLNGEEERQNNEVSKLKNIIQRKETVVNDNKDYENTMNEKIIHMENEMRNLKRSHFENVENLVEENERNILNTKERLMNENTNLKADITSLAENLKLMERSKEEACKQRDGCMIKEEEYQHRLQQLQMEVNTNNEKGEYLEKENLRLINEHENVLSSVQQRAEKNVIDMKNNALKTSATIVELKSKVDDYERSLEELKSNKEFELNELQMINKEELIELESSMNKKTQLFQRDFDAKESKYKNLLEQYSLDLKDKESKYKNLLEQYSSDLKDKEKNISDLNEKLSQQSEEAEHAIELLKNQAEKISANMFQELSNKLLQLQSSVTISKEKVEQQNADVVLRLGEQKNKYEKQHSQYKCHMEEVHSKLQEKYHLEVTELNEKFASQRLEYEEKLKGLLPLHVKIELEDTIDSMRQQIEILQSQTDMLQEEIEAVAKFNV